MATMRTSRRPASFTTHGGEPILQLETPAFARLKQLQIKHLPSAFRMCTKPASEERGRPFQKRRGRKSRPKQTPRSELGKKTEESPAVALSAYPPYVIIPGLQRENRKYEGLTDLVEGATCRLILHLSGEGQSGKEIIDYLHRTCLEPEQRHRFGVDDIRTIMARCKSLGLTAYTVLESDDWDLEVVEKWLIEEDRKHLDPVVYLSSGWWEGIESVKNRNWARWAIPEIGPQNQLSFEENF